MYDTHTIGHGFLRAPDGTLTIFDVPGTVPGFTVGAATFDGLNPAGAFVGLYFDASGVSHAWLRDPDGTINEFDAPHAGTTADQFQGTFADCINPEGAISGWYTDSDNVNHVFVRAPNGEITEFSAPGAGTGAGQGTAAASISPDGTVSGSYVDAEGVSHGFLRSAQGFFTEFNVPGAGTGAGQGTFCYGSNAARASTGYYIDNKGAAHGFVWIP
jgi:hypothetical protein